LTSLVRGGYRHGMNFAPDTYAIIGTILAVGFALAGMGWHMASRLDKRISEDRAAAEADRRQWQASMDAFRQEMLRLAERQSHIEGRIEAAE